MPLKDMQEIDTNLETNIRPGVGAVFKVIMLLAFLAFCIGLMLFSKSKEFSLNDLFTLARDRIFNNYSDSVGTVKIDSVANTVFVPYDLGLLCIQPNGIRKYNSLGQEEWSVVKSIGKPFAQVDGRYLVAADAGGQNLYVFHNKNEIWSKKLEGKILYVSINKRGYVGVIYEDSSYKNIVRIYDNKGTELLARYYANNYAVSVRISPDNKFIAIGEIDTSGLKVSSGVRLIPIGSSNDSGWFEEDSILAGMEFSNKDLIVLLNNKILRIDQALNKTVINDFGNEEITSLGICADKFIVKVQKTGGFLNSASNIITMDNTGKILGTFRVDFNVVNIDAKDNKIVVNGGNKVVFLSSTGKQIAEFSPKKDVKKVLLLRDGKHAAAVYADSFDILDIY